MANVLNEEKKQQVLALGRLGWSLRRIQQATRIRRETAGAYLKAAGVAVRPPGGWGRRAPAKPANEVITDSGAAKPANEVITDPSPPQLDEVGAPSGPEAGRQRGEHSASPDHSPRASACEPYREAIELGLSRGRNARAIWQDLVSAYSFDSSYQSVQRFVRKLLGAQVPQARVVIVTAPGQEAQVDYGTGPIVRDPESGKYRRTRLFVMTLGCSRKSVRLLAFRSSARVWAELHEQAFRRLGGATRIVVLDNLREGVLVPDIYDPALNPLYRDVLAHYGAVAMPCRIQDPDRKGKVESGVGHAQRTPLKGLRFESLEEAQAYLDHWEQRWADTRIHGTTKRQVAAMFAEEKPALLPLPLEPFRYYQYGERIVHLDGCVEVEAAYYGAPPGWIGRVVKVQWDSVFVRLLDPKTGQLLREHVRQKRGWYRIKEEDQPKRTPLRTSQLLWRAGRAGPHIGASAAAAPYFLAKERTPRMRCTPTSPCWRWMASPRCAKDKKDANDHDWISRNTSDPDAQFGQKNFGNKKWYGYKSHANHDVATELAMAVHTTGASSSDTSQLAILVDKEREARGEDAIRTQGGDKGYVGNTEMLSQRDILDYTIPKKNMYAECARKARNTQYLYLKYRRYKVEQKQAEGKRWHHLGNARYRGRWKVHLQGLLTYLVMNLKRIVNLLLPFATA